MAEKHVGKEKTDEKWLLENVEPLHASGEGQLEQRCQTHLLGWSDQT